MKQLNSREKSRLIVYAAPIFTLIAIAIVAGPVPGAISNHINKIFNQTLSSVATYYSGKKTNFSASKPVGWRKKIIPMHDLFYGVERAVRSQFARNKWKKTEIYAIGAKKAVSADGRWIALTRKYAPTFIRLFPGNRTYIKNSIEYYGFILKRMDYPMYRTIQKIRKCCPSYEIYSPQGQKLMKELHTSCKRKGMPLPSIRLKSRDGMSNKTPSAAWEFPGGKAWSTYHMNEWVKFLHWVVRRADAAGVKNQSDFRRMKSNMQGSFAAIEKLL